MRLQITGYDIAKNGELTILHCIDLDRPCKSGSGYRPFVVQRNGSTQEGLWINRSLGFVATKEVVNKMINVEFGPSGRPIKIELIK